MAHRIAKPVERFSAVYAALAGRVFLLLEQLIRGVSVKPAGQRVAHVTWWLRTLRPAGAGPARDRSTVYRLGAGVHRKVLGACALGCRRYRYWLIELGGLVFARHQLQPHVRALNSHMTRYCRFELLRAAADACRHSRTSKATCVDCSHRVEFPSHEQRQACRGVRLALRVCISCWLLGLRFAG